MTIAQIYEEAKRQLDKSIITIGEFSEIVDREYQEPIKWIPVSEPPKEDGKYLVSRKNEENIWVEEAYYSTTSRTTFPKGFSIIKDNFSWRINNVVAWQPLPQPYKAESEDKE